MRTAFASSLQLFYALLWTHPPKRGGQLDWELFSVSPTVSLHLLCTQASWLAGWQGWQGTTDQSTLSYFRLVLRPQVCFYSTWFVYCGAPTLCVLWCTYTLCIVVYIHFVYSCAVHAL